MLCLPSSLFPAMASATVPNSKLKLLASTALISHRTISGRRSPPAAILAVQLAIHRYPRLVVSRATDDGAGSIGADQGIEAFKSSAPGAGYVGLFVRMLGIDNDPLDREQAIIALWKYSQGGKTCIDEIMQFRGCITLTINLLKSESLSTCEAAAGLLRTISSVNPYRDSIAGSGAIEEITGLLSRSFLAAEVKEQTLCTLWNLSVDEKLREKIASTELLPALIKFLDDEEVKVQEAAGGVLANLALSHSNHSIMVEAGVIQKLAEILKSREGSNVTRKEAKSVLLEMAKDEYHRILILEEGLLLVPIIGAAAYKSFRPVSHSWPSLPDGTELERSSSSPSRFGASELLLGLNIKDEGLNMEEAKMNAIVGRTQQQFLARIGAIELENGRKPQLELPPDNQHTLLPWMDGVARLVLILGLDDQSAIARAAQSIADAAINEHMRISFKEAGAVQHLVQLLGHDSDAVRVSVAHALERLAFSNEVCKVIESNGVVDRIVDILKNMNTSKCLVEKTVNILARIFDPSKEMKTDLHYGSVNGSEAVLDVGSRSSEGVTRDKVLDSSVWSRLIEILKTPNPNLQKKAASILEYLAITEPHMLTTTAANIELGLVAVFQQGFFDVTEENIDNEPELSVVQAEEVGSAISAASQLLTKLLDSEPFHSSINSTRLILLLRKVLKSSIPLHAKDWVAACLVKLESSAGFPVNLDNPINMEVTLYGTIPRLLEQIRTSFSTEMQEAAVVELNAVIAKGGVDCTRAVAAQGGIFPLVKMIENASGDALEASLAILYNLSMDSENHVAIVTAGAIPLLRRLVLSEGPQWRHALHLLRTLPT
ncbi:uncharacterized protein LOC131253408 isoform X2 [Magnolia sinica]|uniref:uncharacterized protein LOC131253408 isoform X2 n=1 Tax=Magnolia sinica TaxID=86752 RepID=UPI00265AD2EF|nr:uncharacterized protein LOC131253408 isoform X2 [Magnolia sinica]